MPETYTFTTDSDTSAYLEPDFLCLEYAEGSGLLLDRDNIIELQKVLDYYLEHGELPKTGAFDKEESDND